MLSSPAIVNKRLSPSPAIIDKKGENEDENLFIIPPHYIFEFLEPNTIQRAINQGCEETQNALLLKILFVFKYFSDRYNEKILKEYKAAPEIIPPTTLDPLFVTAGHTNASLQYMSAAYLEAFNKDGDWPIKPEDKDTQLLEIPSVPLDCKSYCGLGYSTLEEYEDSVAYANDSAKKNKFGYRSLEQYKTIRSMMTQLSSWMYGERWVKLPDTSDFSCRKKFEKVFIYNGGYHYARQWGDGTVLSKNGDGARPVWRILSPETAVTAAAYGSVTSIWIRRHKEEVPAPFFRWQSIEVGSEVLGKQDPFNKKHSGDSSYSKTSLGDPIFDNELYHKAKETRDQLLLSSPLKPKRKSWCNLSWCSFFSQLFYKESNIVQSNIVSGIKTKSEICGRSSSERPHSS